MSTFGKRISPDESIARLRGRPSTTDTLDAKNQNGELENAAPLIESFAPREPKFRLKDIILPERAKRELEVLKSRIRNHSLLYNDWCLRAIDPCGAALAVNFYGQPGTGKTMCAEALAAELGKKIIEVNYAEIESKFVGETPKNIRAVFVKAQETDSILFFDEADSILGRRMTNVTQAADHGVNVSRAVMLKQLDAFNGIVIFATNLAKNFDGAFVRRILQHIEIPLPDLDGREKIWRHMISLAVPGRDALDWAHLAASSDGLSGGEIKNAVIISLSETANRSGTERVVSMTDIRRAIEDVKRAKRDIGRYDFNNDSK